MNKNMLMAGLGALALAATAIPAYAQSSTTSGLSVKLGVLYPTDSGIRKATSNTWFGGGLEFRFRDMPVTTPNMKAHLSVSADYFSHNSVNIIPVLVNYVGEQQQTYWMVGVGWAFLHAPGDNQDKFAYQAGLGYNFDTKGANPVFVEVRYVGTSQSHANGVIADVGIRF